MKATPVSFVSLWLSVMVTNLATQVVDAQEYQVTERQLDSKVWKRATLTAVPHGGVPNSRMVWQTNRYVELRNGLCYQAEDGTLQDAREEIEIINGYGVARQGQVKARFAPNLNTWGVVEVWSPEGQHFQSHPLMLAYETPDGSLALISETKDCIGEVVGENQVVYWDAFESVNAAIRYTYTLEGLEQDIIFLNSDVPPPSAFEGFDNQTARLVVMTEFVAAPAFKREATVVQSADSLASPEAANIAKVGLREERLHFGSMVMEQGYAFPLNRGLSEEALPTAKTFEVFEGDRHVLLERIEYRAIKPHLDRLPQASATAIRKKTARTAQVLRNQGGRLAQTLPAAPSRHVQGQSRMKPRQLARAHLPQQGWVMDYTLQLATTNLSSYTFSNDTTYYLSGNVSLYGTTTIEGGCVIKSTNANGTLNRLTAYGPVICKTSAFRPAIITAKDDDLVGEKILGSTGNPTNYYAYYGLALCSTTNFTYDLHDLHIRYADTALFAYPSSRVNLKNSQLTSSRYGVHLATNGCTFRNVLIADVYYGFEGTVTGLTQVGEHLTMHRASSFCSSGLSFYLTNGFIISVTNRLYYTGAGNVYLLSDAGIFANGGAGTRYLSPNSPYRGLGVTNINPDLAKELKTRTTYPPVWLTNTILTDTVLGPQAPRGVIPTQGYHYAPIDYLTKTIISNATLTLTSGAVVASFDGYCVWLADNGRLICHGEANRPNQFVRYASLGESTNRLETFTDNMCFLNSLWGGTNGPSADLRFTDLTVPGATYHYAFYTDHGFARFTMRDCTVSGGYWLLFGGGYGNYAFTNTVFDRVTFDFYAPNQLIMQNNLIRGGYGTLDPGISVGQWSFHDNLIDSSEWLHGSPTMTRSNNAYYASSEFYSIYNTNSTEKVLTSLSYESGPLGHYYYASPQSSVIYAGSTYATNVGLYHYTVTTDQVIAGTNNVSIGFHYVAVGADGKPRDTDGDILWDYKEDSNGNGVYNAVAGESDWTSYTSGYGIGSGPGLILFTPLK